MRAVVPSLHRPALLPTSIWGPLLGSGMIAWVVVVSEASRGPHQKGGRLATAALKCILRWDVAGLHAWPSGGSGRFPTRILVGVRIGECN